MSGNDLTQGAQRVAAKPPSGRGAGSPTASIPGRVIPGRCREVVASLALAVACAGCTVIEISDSKGATRIERTFGFATITIQPNPESVVAKVRSFGVADTPFGFTAGYAAQDFAAVGEDCRVILWLKNTRQLSALKSLVADLNHVCVINPRLGEQP